MILQVHFAWPSETSRRAGGRARGRASERADGRASDRAGERTSERAIVRARRLGVRAPCVVHVDAESGCLYGERVAGRTLKETLRRMRETSDGNEDAEREALRAYGRDIGEQIARLHDGGIVHGDLTTSNFMVRDEDGAIVVIDFGLSYPSDAAEDKGVDLYVLERAITAAHPSQTLLFDVIIDTYEKKSRMWCTTLNRFAEVRARGRKRSMVG